MTRIGILLVVVAIGCSPDDAIVDAPALRGKAPCQAKFDDGVWQVECPNAPVNASGLGKACSSDADCAGLEAATCLRGQGYAFCSRKCFAKTDGWPSCGTGGRCQWRPSGPAMCVPKVCSDLTCAVPPEVRVRIPCDGVGQVNDTGVGKPCEAVKDCLGFGGSSTCPWIVHSAPGTPSWCSQLCGEDADCGPGAFCWWRNAPDHGWVGACTPLACKATP